LRVWRGEPSLGRDIGENAAIVVVEVVSMDAADEDIFPAVVVIIAHGMIEPPFLRGRPSPSHL
jgi:hypothetical protein